MLWWRFVSARMQLVFNHYVSSSMKIAELGKHGHWPEEDFGYNEKSELGYQ